MPDESGIPSLKLSREMEKLAYEARAHIVWGKSPAAVHDEMLRCGADEETALRVIHVCMNERMQLMRYRGWRDLLIAIPVIVFCAAFAQIMFEVHSNYQEELRKQFDKGIVDRPRREWQRSAGTLAMLSAVGFAVGLFFAVRGIQRLLAKPRANLTNKQSDPWGEGLEIE